MPKAISKPHTFSSATEVFLSGALAELRTREIDHLRLYPLILQAPLETLFSRRRRLFDFFAYERREYGFELTFKRQLKRSKNHPTGGECQGVFHLLPISENLVLVASSLAGDDHRYGPRRFTEKAYPLARRPFIPSTALTRLIDQFGAAHHWTATALDTSGYHRQSRKLRRDLERQPPAAAAREMAEQGRQVHRMLVSFRHGSRETARLSFDRHGTLNLLKGNPSVALRDLVIPGISEATAADATYQVSRASVIVKQEVVELDFLDEPFDSYGSMHTLCDAVREADGLNLAIIHLNPYLQAQILDFFTGAAVEMLVTDNRSVSLVPRSGDCGPAIQRIVTTIFRYFGEGKPKRTRLGEDR